LADEHKLIVWARGWFTAEIQRGRAFADIRREFNAASPLLCSLHNAMDAADRDETEEIVASLERAYRRAVRNCDD